MNLLSCSFTGHRPQRFSFGYDENSFDCMKLKYAVKEQIEAMIGRGVRSFLSGMALGVDTWAAEAVLKFREQGYPVRLTCVLPCETQANRWTVAQSERYFDILSRCDDTVYIGRRYISGCMLQRDRYLVDHSDILIAVYDGCGRGGTAYTVNYAFQKNRPVVVIDPDTLRITRFFAKPLAKQATDNK